MTLIDVCARCGHETPVRPAPIIRLTCAGCGTRWEINYRSGR